ncbi:MAG TPA: hypothetical protein VFA95_00005 [Gammaproteobacteria bacterium]|nr:hypothetical protein [Gammaproteobacteria bacterium]
MDIFYVDRPLSQNQLEVVARIFGGLRDSGAWSTWEQRRVPCVLPTANPEGRLSLPLRSYVPLFQKHFRILGLAPGGRRPVAIVLPERNPFGGALALALRDVTGISPYVIVRRKDVRESVCVIEPGSVLDVLDHYRCGRSDRELSGRGKGSVFTFLRCPCLSNWRLHDET